MGKQYADKGELGSPYENEMPFKDPAGLKRFDGYGATTDDLERGYCDPEIRELPDYDKKNYQDRSTLPKAKHDNLDGSLPILDDDDWKFRNKDVQTKGFLTRPRLPTER